MWFDKAFSFSRKEAPVPRQEIPREISTYTLDERRTNRYTFTSMKALQGYFSTWLAEEDIREVIESAKIGFMVRRGATPEETRLQFLKKCEYCMVRMLRSGAATA
jgi:hypothetical protein